MDILNNNIELVIVICLVVILAVIILFMSMRDKEINRRLEIFEKTIEDINQQNYELKKMVKEKMFHNTLEDNQELNEMLQKEVQSKIQPLQKSLKEIEEITKSFQEKQKDEVLHVKEESVNFFEDTFADISKETVTFSKPAFEEDDNEPTAQIDDNFDYEKKICELHKSGKSEKEIAELLNLKDSEVAFVLSLNS